MNQGNGPASFVSFRFVSLPPSLLWDHAVSLQELVGQDHARAPQRGRGHSGKKASVKPPEALLLEKVGHLLVGAGPLHRFRCCAAHGFRDLPVRDLESRFDDIQGGGDQGRRAAGAHGAHGLDPNQSPPPRRRATFVSLATFPERVALLLPRSAEQLPVLLLVDAVGPPPYCTPRHKQAD